MSHIERYILARYEQLAMFEESRDVARITDPRESFRGKPGVHVIWENVERGAAMLAMTIEPSEPLPGGWLLAGMVAITTCKNDTYFDIEYINDEIPLDDVEDAVLTACKPGMMIPVERFDAMISFIEECIRDLDEVKDTSSHLHACRASVTRVNGTLYRATCDGTSSYGTCDGAIEHESMYTDGTRVLVISGTHVPPLTCPGACMAFDFTN